MKKSAKAEAQWKKIFPNNHSSSFNFYLVVPNKFKNIFK